MGSILVYACSCTVTFIAGACWMKRRIEHDWKKWERELTRETEDAR